MKESMTISELFERKLKELEKARDLLNQAADSVGDLGEKLGNKQTDLKVVRQERAKLESQVKSVLSEIKGNLTTDIGDVEKAHNKMGEYKKLIKERDEASVMVEGLEREISTLKRSMEEKKREARKDTVEQQRELSIAIDILIRAAKLFEVSLEPKSVKTKPEAKPKEANEAPGREPVTPSTSPSSRFVLSEDQRIRIDQLGDYGLYGLKFANAGVLRKNSDFADNGDILESVVNGEFESRVAHISRDLPNLKWVLRAATAVRNRIFSAPILQVLHGDVDTSTKVETFIEWREQEWSEQKAHQQALQPKAS